MCMNVGKQYMSGCALKVLWTDVRMCMTISGSNEDGK
jgi:hypothetical protein